MGAIHRAQVGGNPYVGLFLRASDGLALLPPASAHKLSAGAMALAGRQVALSVDGSPFLGIFIAMNSWGAVVPKIAGEKEIAMLKTEGLDVLVLQDGRFSACGNNVACNDHGALINPDMPREEARKIADALSVECEQAPLAGYKCPGMACVATNRGWVAHNRISEGEAGMLESLFNCHGLNCTVNSGTALVGAGLCANSHGALVGMASSGFELARVSQALDLA